MFGAVLTQGSGEGLSFPVPEFLEFKEESRDLGQIPRSFPEGFP